MTTTNFPNLPAHLRKWGLKVVEVKGWQSRTANGGFSPRGIVAHHTASNKDSGNASSLGIVVHGRPGIPGPLAQFLLARDGTVYIVSGNRANHAGLGGPTGDIPKDSANLYCWGIEAENDGIGEKWTAGQLTAYYRLCAALLALMGVKSVKNVFGHKEWTSRKIDPAGITMSTFRLRVAQALAVGVVSKPRFARLKNLRQGKHNVDVTLLQRRLVKLGLYHGTPTGTFGQGTANAIARFQKKQGWKGSGKIGALTYLKLFGRKA